MVDRGVYTLRGWLAFVAFLGETIFEHILNNLKLSGVACFRCRHRLSDPIRVLTNGNEGLGGNN